MATLAVLRQDVGAKGRGGGGGSGGSGGSGGNGGSGRGGGGGDLNAAVAFDAGRARLPGGGLAPPRTHLEANARKAAMLERLKGQSQSRAPRQANKSGGEAMGAALPVSETGISTTGAKAGKALPRRVL